MGLLRGDDHWTSHSLAKTLEISHRTIMRDLNELRDLGYPVETDRGRGGGTRLYGRWGINKFHFTNQDAISLLLCLSVTEALTTKTNDLGAKELKQKIANVFPEKQRKTINELRSKILNGSAASTEVLKNFTKSPDLIWKQIMSTFFDTKRIQITYLNEKSVETKREIDPHFLLLNWPVWYLLGWDYLRNDVRMFRIDRIKKVIPKTENILRRPRSIFLDSYETYFKNI